MMGSSRDVEVGETANFFLIVNGIFFYPSGHKCTLKLTQRYVRLCAGCLSGVMSVCALDA